MGRIRSLLAYWLDLVDEMFWETPPSDRVWIYLRCPGCAGNVVTGCVRTTFIHDTMVTEYQCPSCHQRHLFQTERYVGLEPVPFLITGKLKDEYERRYYLRRPKRTN